MTKSEAETQLEKVLTEETNLLDRIERKDPTLTADEMLNLIAINHHMRQLSKEAGHDTRI